MSPTIIRGRGFRIMIFYNDHPPPHVHVLQGGRRARVYLSPVRLWHSEMKANDTRRAVELVRENHDTLLQEWRNIHGTDAIE